MSKLKEFEGDNIRSDFLLIAFDEASKINPNETNHHNTLNKARNIQNKQYRKALNKELKKYSSDPMFFETTEGDKFNSLPAFASEPLSAIETKTLIPDIRSMHYLSQNLYIT